MIYLDFSATTPTSEDSLNAFFNASKETGNSNSIHALGTNNRNKMVTGINEIKKLLDAEDKELIVTSGASEANNLALFGVFEKYRTNTKCEIITTDIEHSSVIAACSKLMKMSAVVKFVPLKEDGTVDEASLLEIISDKTLMVSIGAINSELGIIQPINKLADLVKEKYPEIIFHSDITQAIGKIKIDLSNIDLASFSAHKFYSPIGVGGLLRNKKIKLVPQIVGGDSVSVYRSGTPAYPLVAAMEAGLKYTLDDFESKEQYVKDLNNYLREELGRFNSIRINSPKDAVAHILNVSITGKDAAETQKYLSDNDIYLSTRSACASNNDYSRIVDNLYHDMDRAKSSIRISLSFLTTKEELNILIKFIGAYIK